jgi:hypothetical protein
LTLHAHSRFRQTEMQGLLGLGAQIAVYRDEVARPRGFTGDDDLIITQPGFQRELSGLQGTQDHALVDDLFRFLAEIPVSVLLHFLHDQFLVQGAAIDANANRFTVVASDFADRRKLFVTALTGADVARIDPVFIQRYGTGRILVQQNVPVVMEVSDDGYAATRGQKALLDIRYGGCGFRNVDGPANDFRPGFSQLHGLHESSFHVDGVGVGHGLHHDGCATANTYVAYGDAIGFTSGETAGGFLKALDLGEHGPSILT